MPENTETDDEATELPPSNYDRYRTGEGWDRMVGKNVADLRRARKLTQEQLADEVNERRGLSFRQQTINKIERGVRPLRFWEADAIADILEVDTDVLADEEVIFDETIMLMRQVQRLGQSWEDLRKAVKEMCFLTESLKHDLHLIGNRDGVQVSQSTLNEAEVLCQLDPQRVVQTSIAEWHAKQEYRSVQYEGGLLAKRFVRDDHEEAEAADHSSDDADLEGFDSFRRARIKQGRRASMGSDD